MDSAIGDRRSDRHVKTQPAGISRSRPVRFYVALVTPARCLFAAAEALEAEGEAEAAGEHRHRVRLRNGHDGHIVAAGQASAAKFAV